MTKPRDIPNEDANLTAKRIITEMVTWDCVTDAHIAGSIRRGAILVSDIDLVITTREPELVKELLAGSPLMGEPRRTMFQVDGIQVDLCLVTDDCVGAALLHFTGPVRSNIRMRVQAKRRGLVLSQWGLVDRDTGVVVAARTEADVYDALGLPFVAPEDRR